MFVLKIYFTNPSLNGTDLEALCYVAGHAVLHLQTPELKPPYADQLHVSTVAGPAVGS
jgi:hypothetical protein